MGIPVKNRTVAEMVEDIAEKSPDAVFYIGSKSGFFFIGTKAVYDADIDGLSNRTFERYKQLLRTIKERIKENSTAHFHIEQNETPEHFARRLKNTGERLASDLATADNYTKVVEKWKHMSLRKVKEAYKKDPVIDSHGIVLLVDGFEAGVWFKEEYKNGGNVNGIEKD